MLVVFMGAAAAQPSYHQPYHRPPHCLRPARGTRVLYIHLYPHTFSVLFRPQASMKWDFKENSVLSSLWDPSLVIPKLTEIYN